MASLPDSWYSVNPVDSVSRADSMGSVDSVDFIDSVDSVSPVDTCPLLYKQLSLTNGPRGKSHWGLVKDRVKLKAEQGNMGWGMGAQMSPDLPIGRVIALSNYCYLIVVIYL